MTVVKDQAASSFMRFERITKENGTIYKCTRERVDDFILEGAAPMVQTVVRTRFDILLIVNYVLLYFKKGFHKSVSQHQFIGVFFLLIPYFVTIAWHLKTIFHCT